MKTLDLYSSRQECAAESGATMLEFAIVALVFLVCVIAVIDFGRVYLIQSLLSSAANRAVSSASVISGFESSDSDVADAALASVRATAVDFAVSTLLSPVGTPSAAQLFNPNADAVSGVEFILPAGYSEDDSRPRSLESEPIQVRMFARVHLFTPLLSPLTLSGYAAGYREARITFSAPIALDCEGVPLAEGGNAVEGCECPTDPDNTKKEYDPKLGICVCQGNLVPAGEDCVCPPDPVRAADLDGDNYCDCTITKEYCLTEYPSADPSKVGYKKEAGAGKCKCFQCSGVMIADQTTDYGTCVCPTGSPTEADCNALGKIFSGCACADCAAPTVFIASQKACLCSNWDSCGPTRWADWGNGCSCVCNSGLKELDASLPCAPKSCSADSCHWDGSQWVRDE